MGAGPVGLRLAIECALLGARCIVVEKRDKFVHDFPKADDHSMEREYIV